MVQKIPVKYCVVFLIIIFLHSNYLFFKDSEKKFIALNFQWNQKIKQQEVPNCKVISITKDRLVIECDSLLETNPNLTYALKYSNNKTFYYRFLYSKIKQDTITFSYVEWINGVPKHYGKTAKIISYDIPLKQKTGKKILFAGDYLLWNNNAKYLLKNIYIDGHFKFLGSKKNVYNINYEAYGKWDITDIIQALKNNPNADIYVLFFDIYNNQNQKHIENLIHFLGNKKKSQIIWILPPSKTAIEKNLQYHIKRSAKQYPHIHFIEIDQNNALKTERDYSILAQKVLKSIK